jgi:hypothetical protein
VSTEEGVYTLHYNRKGQGQLLQLDGKTLSLHSAPVQLPKKLSVDDLSLLENRFYGAGIRKKVPYLFSLDGQSGSLKIVPSTWQGTKPKDLKILSVEKVPGSNEVFFFVRMTFKKQRTELWIFGADEEGNPSLAVNLSDRITENLINASASCIGRGEYIFTGTYSKDFSNSSQGMFFCHLSQGKPKFMKLYDFLDMEHFLEYLPERKQERIARKKARKEAQGKDFSINYFLAAHQIIPTGDGYLYFAEAYYPTYRTETHYTTSFVNGSAVRSTTTTTVFDGYQYTHAVLAKFDENGDLAWDQEFELWPAYKPFYVKKFVHLSPDTENTVDMLFTSRGKLHFKSFDYNGQSLIDESSEKIDTGMEGDETKWAFSEMYWWYGKNFLAYGTQKIKNKELEKGERRRKVFFVNKIRYGNSE